MTPDIVLATRSDARLRQLPAFLRHHMQWCSRAFVLVCARPGEDVSEVTGYLDAEWPGKAMYDILRDAVFSNSDGMVALRDFIASHPPADLVLHLDKDEFIPRFTDVRGIASSLVDDRYDYAEGWMACRLGPGLSKYPDNLPTYDAFHAAAPVRAEVVKAHGMPTRKVWLAGWPHTRIHSPLDGWRKAPGLSVIDHFTWTGSRLALFKEKAFMHLHNEADYGWVRDYAKWEVMFDKRGDEAMDIVKRTFIPISCSVPGWFNYRDMYQMIVDKAPAGSTVVEIGVYRGRSLAYMAEYAALVGKKLDIVGIDQFDPGWKPVRPMPVRMPYTDSDDMLRGVSSVLAECAPWNTPRLVRGDSAESAALFPDGSVFAVWIDGDHSEEGVRRDVLAWLPKVAPGGILAGHDLGVKPFKVAEGLAAAGVRYSSAGVSSWVADPSPTTCCIANPPTP